jgi:hypothetical protein
MIIPFHKRPGVCIPIAAFIISLTAASDTARAAIIIDTFSTSHNASINIGDPPIFPILSASSGVLTTAIGGARMLQSYVTAGQEDDQYRLRVSNASGFASIETSALVSGKGLITYNGTTGPGAGVTAGNFNAPANFNLPVTDITQGGANTAIIISAHADNNGIPIVFTMWVNSTTYARGVLNLPGSASAALQSYSLAFSDFTATGASLASILTGVRAITVELQGTHPSVTQGTDVVLDYIIADTTVPEPGTYALMGGALLGFGLLKRRVTG